jgi:hypothetical protein
VEKLIIHHGDRVTEHELRDAPLTIGRDPECDLFFADKKLSRRHARVERAGVGLRLVDLESRNGTWVNEERIDVRDLVPGDEIRLGGLRIYIEGEPEQDEADQSTLYLGAGTPPSLDTGTVALSASAAAAVLPPEAAPLSSDDSSTVFLRASAAPSPSSSLAGLDEGDETLKKPEPEKTVVFAGQPPRSLFDTGTVVYRAQADPSLQDAATRRAPPKAPPPEEVELVEDVEASLPALTASMTYIPAAAASGGRGWAARFAPLAAGLGVFALLVVALPLLRILSAALVEESSSRGRALVGLLAAANEAALAEGRAQDVSIERVESEPGVVSAYILAPTGEVLAPKAHAGETPAPLVTEIDGLTGGIGEVRSFHEGRASSGDRVLAQPVMNRGRRVGVAVLSLRSPAVGSPWVALLLGSLLLAIAVLGVVLLARKMTVSPLNDLRLEVDALGEGRRAELPVERPYSELSQLASSLNRVLASRQGFRGSEPLDPRKPGALGRH